MRAADDFEQIMSLFACESDESAGTVKVYLLKKDGSHILAKINHRAIPLNQDLTVNWSQVTRLQIMKVEVTN